MSSLSSGRPRRILLISSTSNYYGGEVSLLHVLRHFDRAEWDLSFMLPGPGEYERRVLASGRPVVHFDISEDPPEWGRVQRLAALIRRAEPDLVHLNLHFAWREVSAACLFARVPLVLHIRNMIAPGRPGRLDRWLFRRAARFICIGDAVKRALLESGLTSPATAARIATIADARELSAFRRGNRARFRAEMDAPEGVPLIGMVARLESMKGQDLFLAAARTTLEQVPGARFLIIGDSVNRERPYVDELHRIAEEGPLRGRVRFLGYRSDVPDILAGLDCFVHSSRRGAFVSVLIEAMAAGVPIVASDVDGIPECLGRDGVAELVSPIAAEGFAEAVLRVIREPSRAAAMRKAGQERASRLFEAAPLARATESVFRQALSD